MSVRRQVLSALFILPLACRFALPEPTHGQRHSGKPDPVISRLAKTYSFAFGGVGFALATSEGETMYRTLLSRPSAAADFEKVFAIGNPQAKCYALVGLRQVRPDRFEFLAKTWQSSKAQVPVSRGCLTYSKPMAEVIQEIRSGIYSGPLIRDLIPPPANQTGTGKQPASTPNQKEGWVSRVLSLFFLAGSVPAPLPPRPSPPPGPPPPPAARLSH